MSTEKLQLPENWEDQIDWGDDEEESSPPEAASTDEGTTPAETALPFHNVAPAQLVLLTLATFGMYLPVWFYRNWVAFHRYRDGKPRHLMALLRTVFSPVLYWDLAGQIDTVARKVDAPGSTHPMLWARSSWC